MTAEVVHPCCPSRTCQRQQPMRLYRDPEGWWIATQYAEVATNGVGQVFQRHRVHPDDAAYLNALLDRDTGSGEGRKG